MDDCVPSTENNHDPKQHRTRVDSNSSYVVLRETATLKPGVNSSNRNAKQTKQRRKPAKKPEKSNRKDGRNVVTVNRGHLHDKSQVERPTNKCSHGLCYHRLLQFLVLFFSVTALGLVILMVLGVLGPDRCSCSQKDASPRAGAQSSSEEPTQQSSTLKQNTFNLDLSPFHGILDELQANVSSLRRQAESMMKESNENKDALMAAKAKFNNTREAVTNFVSQINTVINHVNNSVQQFDPDNGPIFNRLQDLNATLQRELGEMKQTYEQYNIDIDNRIDVMNNTIAEKVAIKLSEPGPIGERGQNGSKGPTGETGPPGPQGPNGTKSAKGPRGDKGLQGDSGFPGRNGSKGLTGDKGIKGPKGDNGTTGPAGNPGEEGTRGIGNFSWCEQTFVEQTTGNIRRNDTQNIKIIGASCTTATPGAEANLQTTGIANGYKYDCVCKPGTPICRLNYWACPIMAP